MSEQMTSIANEDAEFLKSLRYHLMSAPSERFALRRAFGHDVKEDIGTYMAFLKVSGNHIMQSKEDIYFLIACLFYLSEKPDGTGTEKRYVSFEELFGRLYGKTDSMDSRISHMVNSSYDANGMFHRQFVGFAKQCINEVRAGERIDYYRLLQDLKFWDADDRSVRLRWARTITKIKIEKGEREDG